MDFLFVNELRETRRKIVKDAVKLYCFGERERERLWIVFQGDCLLNSRLVYYHLKEGFAFKNCANARSNRRDEIATFDESKKTITIFFKNSRHSLSVLGCDFVEEGS